MRRACLPDRATRRPIQTRSSGLTRRWANRDCDCPRSAFETLLPIPTDCSHRQRVFPSQLNFFGFVADHEALALAQCVLHLFQLDFHFQQLAPVGHWKSKDGIVLGRATWPERQSTVVVPHTAET